MSPDERFISELDHLQRESDAATQFLYMWLAFHKYASDNRNSMKAFRRHALYWNTHLGGLQAGIFMTLGRIFDEDPRSHGVARLVREMTNSPQIFSRTELRKRMEKESPGASWVGSYVTSAYEPTTNDFRRLRRYVDRKRSIYKGAYRQIRHKVFAHSGAGSKERRDALFAKTTIGELQRLVLSLRALREAMWQMYFNGRRPEPRIGSYSVKSMEREVSKLPQTVSFERRVFAEAYTALSVYVAGTQQ